jgi:hypothetical protein
MEVSFITVNKIIKNRNGELMAEPEMIRLDEIKSSRIWHKNDLEKIAFKSDLTIVYMRDRDEDNKVVIKAIKIVEPYAGFLERINIVTNGFKGEGKLS